MSGEAATGASVHALSKEEWANTGNAIEGPVISAIIISKWDKTEEDEEEEEIVEDEASDDAF